MRTALIPLLSLALSCAFAQQAPTVETTQLTDTLYYLKGRGGAMVASVGEDGIVLVDDDIKPVAPAIREALDEVSKAPIKFVINTHWHGDHTGGNEHLASGGALIVAHDNVRERMSTEQFSEFSQSTTPPAPDAALPVVTFSANVTLHVNGEAVTAYHVPGAHTDGDSIVHFPASKVLHMGDAFWNGHYPRIDTDTGASVQGAMAAVRQGLSLCRDGTRVVAGHGPLGDCADLRAFLDMLEATTGRVEALMAEGKSLAEIQVLKPNADYDETWGTWYIKPDDFLMFVHQSLERSMGG